MNHRGAARAEIFDSDEDRQVFLALLSDIARRFAIETHCYCLMNNHYHLLVHTPRGGVARGTRHVSGLYTQHLNRKRGTDGPLFRGRYKSIVVEDDVYLLQVSRYIHLNPLSAGLVDDPTDYAGSSCGDYMHKPTGFASLDLSPSQQRDMALYPAQREGDRLRERDRGRFWHAPLRECEQCNSASGYGRTRGSRFDRRIFAKES